MFHFVISGTNDKLDMVISNFALTLCIIWGNEILVPLYTYHDPIPFFLLLLIKQVPKCCVNKY